MSRIVQIRDLVQAHPVKMKKRELTAKQIASVSCPTCGADIGDSCELNSGAPRSEPHVDRKFAAIEAIEKKSA